MKCANCGEELPKNGYKCLRCGTEFNSIATRSSSDKDDEDFKDNDDTETKDIPASQIHMSKAGGSIFDGVFGGGNIFGNIFGGGGFGGGGFGSIIDDLFGGFFGEEESDGYDDDPKHYDDFGNEIYLPDEFERDCVEIHEVEEITQLDEENKKSKRKHKDDKEKK